MTRPLSPRSRYLLLAGTIALTSSMALSGCGVIQSLLQNRETRDDSGAITEGGTTDDVFTLSEGDCLNDDALSSAASGDPVEVYDAPTVPCGDPHGFEVTKNVTVDESAGYPGDDALVSEADAKCLAVFTDFVGISFEESVLNYSYDYPTESSWGDGDRVISCLVFDEAGNTTGSLASVGR